MAQASYSFLSKTFEISKTIEILPITPKATSHGSIDAVMHKLLAFAGKMILA
jgi:hypothetical protein